MNLNYAGKSWSPVPPVALVVLAARNAAEQGTLELLDHAMPGPGAVVDGNWPGLAGQLARR
jgi:hypothetical protein